MPRSARPGRRPKTTAGRARFTGAYGVALVSDDNVNQTRTTRFVSLLAFLR